MPKKGLLPRNIIVDSTRPKNERENMFLLKLICIYMERASIITLVLQFLPIALLFLLLGKSASFIARKAPPASLGHCKEVGDGDALVLVGMKKCSFALQLKNLRYIN